MPPRDGRYCTRFMTLWYPLIQCIVATTHGYWIPWISIWGPWHFVPSHENPNIYPYEIGLIIPIPTDLKHGLTMARQNWGFLDPQVTMELNTPWSSTWINPGRESPVAELTQHSPLKWTIRSKWYTHCSWILQEVHLFIHLLQSLYRQRHGSRWVISAESMRGSLLFWGYHFTRLFLGKMLWNFEVELK